MYISLWYVSLSILYNITVWVFRMKNQRRYYNEGEVNYSHVAIEVIFNIF